MEMKNGEFSISGIDHSFDKNRIQSFLRTKIHGFLIMMWVRICWKMFKINTEIMTL
jgi:hypothetical protein